MIKFRLFGFGNHQEPAATPSPEVQQKETSSFGLGPPPNPNGKRVLIVDDDPVFLKATAMKLNSAGFQVATVKEGSEAITALGENRADAILMDINFPADVCNGGMGSWDGFQLISWLRGLPTAKGARFIVVSDSDTAIYRKRAKDLGVTAYFQKPLDHDLLLAAVN